ncbi:MAG TPA: hypothetical protein VME01_09090, partial [Solirubrobacteraceae bacterium]|nr:hypothetical protein [Solirubrobacteraceae bacterium]
MSARPPVSVVVPFAGSRDDAHTVIAMLRALTTQPGDELILADNSGTAPALPHQPQAPGDPS